MDVVLSSQAEGAADSAVNDRSRPIPAVEKLHPEENNGLGYTGRALEFVR